MKSAVVLLSGGLDSSTLLHYVARERQVATIYALSLIYGQKHSRELNMARYQAAQVPVTEHRVADVSFFADIVGKASVLTSGGAQVPDLEDVAEEDRDQPPTYVPHRNLLLLALASAYAESVGVRDVFYGAQAQDEYGYWDCTGEFVERLNRVLGLNRRNAVTVHAPFTEMKKSAVVKIGLELGVDYSHTWTCYRGEARACRRCPACVERAAAFEANSVQDPVLDLAG